MAVVPVYVKGCKDQHQKNEVCVTAFVLGFCKKYFAHVLMHSAP